MKDKASKNIPSVNDKRVITRFLFLPYRLPPYGREYWFEDTYSSYKTKWLKRVSIVQSFLGGGYGWVDFSWGEDK